MTISQKATLTNAISTFLSGAGLIIFQKQFMTIFETASSTPFWIVGAVITYFSLTMFAELKKQRALALLWIITQDTLWVFASVVILIMKPFDISATGYLLIGLFLIPILFFIVYQSVGLSGMDDFAETDLKRVSFNRKVQAAKADVWKVISDVANYDKVTSGLSDVTIISGEGEGMVRSCSHGNNSWQETCNLWEPEKQYSFTVDTSAQDYPFPLKHLKGTWVVNELDIDNTEIVMEFDFQFKKKFQNILVYPFAKHQFAKGCTEILDNWQEMVEK